MATFSFSHTGNFWKTRYSFEPSQYTHMDRTMLSYNPVAQLPEESVTIEVLNSQPTAWRHNVSNAPLNNFYGSQYESRIVLSSNQDPSAEKVFKALSLESNQNVFNAIVFTNVDLQGYSTTEVQQSSAINEFIPKEENLYAHISPSVINSTSNLRPVGLVKSYNSSSNTVTVYGEINDIPVGAIPVFVRTLSDGSTVLSAAAYPQNNSSTAAVFTSDIEVFQGSIYQFNNYVSNNGAAEISGATVYQNQTIIDIGGAGILDNSYIVSDDTRLMALLNPAIHGDTMRGKYLLVSLSTKPGMEDRPFELYAVNVEYSYSNLDSRLGQNS